MRGVGRAGADDRGGEQDAVRSAGEFGARHRGGERSLAEIHRNRAGRGRAIHEQGDHRARLEALVDAFIPGLRFLSSWRSQATVVALSLATWLMEGCVFWIVMRGFAMEAPFHAAFFTLVIVNIAIMVPAGPGYLGTFEAAAVVALAPFRVPDSAAVSYILVVHLLQYVSVTVLGLWFMNASGWSLREIEEAGKE